MTSSIRKLRYCEYALVLAGGFVLFWLATRSFYDGKNEAAEVAGLLLGFGLIAMAVIKFFKTIKRDVRNYIVLKSGTGSIRVHAAAIEESLRHTAKSLPEVHDVRVRLVIDKQTQVPSAGNVEARVKDITNIVTVHDALSRVLTERYEQIMGDVAPPIEFNLTIKYHFRPPTPASKERRRRGLPAEEDETQAIRAPQYPVPK